MQRSVSLLAAACAPEACPATPVPALRPLVDSLHEQLAAQLGHWPAHLLAPGTDAGEGSPLATIEELFLAVEQAIGQQLAGPSLISDLAPHLGPWLLHVSPQALVRLFSAAASQQGTYGGRAGQDQQQDPLVPPHVAHLLRQAAVQLRHCVHVSCAAACVWKGILSKASAQLVQAKGDCQGGNLGAKWESEKYPEARKAASALVLSSPHYTLYAIQGYPMSNVLM